MTLQQCFNKELVKKQLQEILLTARHNDAVEREVQFVLIIDGLQYRHYFGVVALKSQQPFLSDVFWSYVDKHEV